MPYLQSEGEKPRSTFYKSCTMWKENRQGTLHRAFSENESYYTNALGHSWEDLRKSHCNMMQEITVQNGQPAPELIHDIMKHKACGFRQEYSCYICLDVRKQKSKSKNQETQETIVDQFSSGSNIEKPYVLTRSKVDFTMEDLENASEDEDDFSPNLSVPDISERLQLNRICKRDLFLNQ